VPLEVRKIHAEEDCGKLRIYGCCWRRGGQADNYLLPYTVNNAVLGYTILSVKAPGGEDEGAKRIKAPVKVLTGEEPNIDNNHERAKYTRRRLECLKRYAELVAVVEKWEKSA
jgi:hypothetical protein